MSRFARWLRAALLSLAGVATLGWGVAQWWTFYRDLYVEEELALQALADKAGYLSYRRAGDLEQAGRWKHETSPGDPAGEIEIPWSVPFVGRVEYVHARPPMHHSPRTPSPPATGDAIDRVLTLPGVRGFDGGNVASESVETGDLALLPLGRPLPELPSYELTPAALSEPMPRGTPLSEAEERAFVETLLQAWSEERAEAADARSRLVRCEMRLRDLDEQPLTIGTLYLLDGEKRLSCYDAKFLWNDGGNLTIADRQYVRKLFVTPNRREEVSRFDRSTPEAKSALPDSPQQGFSTDPTELARDEASVLSEGAGRAVRVERIDDQRTLVETSFDPASEEEGDPWLLRAVVRTDLKHAVERWDRAYLSRGSSASWDREREARRLESIAGEPVVVESISDTVYAPVEEIGEPAFPEETTAANGAWRQRFAVEFEPDYSPALFDPATYGVALLARPRELPVVRTYRVAWTIGGLCLFAAIVGALAMPGGRRAAKSSAPSKGWLPRPRFRFGMLSVVAGMLILIAVAGWAKSFIDEARDEFALLMELHTRDEALGLGGELGSYERAEPEFPWSLVSTDSLPIGAPLTDVTLSSVPPAERYDRLLARWPAIQVDVCDYSMHYAEPEHRAPPLAIGVALQEFAPDERHASHSFLPIEEGVLLSPNETEQVVAEIREAWRRGKETAPVRYLVLRRHDQKSDSDEVTLRDGERCWGVESLSDPREIWTDDGRYFRRFGLIDGAWRIVSRNDAGEAAGEYSFPPAPFRAIYSSALDGFDESLVLPCPPFASPACFMPIQRRLDEALLGDAADLDVRVERLDDDLFRIEIERTFPAASPEWPPGSGRWIAVVQRDMDWCVERCEALSSYAVTASSSDPEAFDPFAELWGDSFSNTAGQDPLVTEGLADAWTPTQRIVKRQRVVRRRNDLVRIGGRVVANESHWMGADWPEGTLPEWHFASERVVLDPPLDERIFSRPSLDEPPPVTPREPSFFGWHVVAGLVGVALLCVGPSVACARAIRALTIRSVATPGKDSA